MQIQVNVLAVTPPTSKVDKNGKPYSEIEVVYRSNGETRNKKLNSYGKAVYSVFSSAVAGEIYTVEMEKKGEFWNWIKAVRGGMEGGEASAAPAAASGAAPNPVPTKWKEREYESKEERQFKQVYIIKQSSLAAAINTLSVGAKSLSPEAVINLAQEYTDWVLARPAIEPAQPPEFAGDEDQVM